MKIGRTNAITISGGTTKTDYELWQEGFGANWDSVIQNSPSTGVQPVLHVYTKVNSLRHISTFPTNVTIVTYNPTTGIYRPVILDANKNLFFEESDYFMNSYDGMYYSCVIYKTINNWGSTFFVTTLPIVYSNTKFCSGVYTDIQVSLIGFDFEYPFLRGVDCYNPTNLYLFNSIEHLTVSVYKPTITISRISGSDTQVRVLKEFVEKAPIGTVIVPFNQALLIQPSITDAKLADWFFNDFFYNNFNGTAYGENRGITTKNVRKFKINSNILLTTAYQLNCIPNCCYLEGTFTEKQTNDAASAGFHKGFQTSAYTLLQNFPMWTVLDGATTGCLLPRPQGSTVNDYANFIFYSKNLERKYFCEFDSNGTIIEDPAKYFLCNLPIQQYVSGQTIRFVTNTFWSLFTAAEISEIERYIGLKNWGIIWQ